MIRKGRPVSHAGRDADGPCGDDPDGDPFDSFESFDAHDQAAGRAPSAQRGSTSADSGDAAGSPAETTYTRSRRTPGEARPDDDRAEKKHIADG